ncbi:uncharacterized protein PG986_011267 [Apiospora aurea]|uniref:Protein kinase domain-containing protein n=1 Tax=Apiospora aurea TaxID=335848 RepID=A0ABR1Q531_9PEZI
MEPIGLVASVATLVKVVDKTVEGARRIAQQWKEAPAEIKALTEYLHHMQSLLTAIRNDSRGQANQFMLYAISRNVSGAEDLCKVLETDILDEEKEPSSRVIKAAWLRHQKKVSKLKEALSKEQDLLHLALSASNYFRSDQVNGTPQGPVSVGDVRVDLSNTKTEIGTTAESITRLGKTALPKSPFEVVWPDGDVSQINRHGEASSTSLEQYSTSSQQPGPATSLECSPNFMPETYTTDRAPLIFYDSQEISQSMNHRDVTYTLLILRRRQFTRVTLHMEVNRDSAYWPALRAKPASIGYRKAYEPPATLLNALDKFLHGRKALPQDAQIDMFLGHRQGNFIVDHKPRQRQKRNKRELIHSPVSWKYEAIRIQAKPKSSGWAIEVRFNAREDHMDEELYALRILYALRGNNGFRSLIGLVEDDDGKISGFLCRNPSLGPLLDVISRAKQHGTLVDWARRERWCRQIVQGISDLHGLDYKHGSLGRFLRNGLYVDEHDNVVFLNSFRKSFTYADDLQDLSIPPECQDQGDSGDGAASAIPAQPATDIYQLGLILWCIAANEEAVYRSMVCENDDIEAPEDEYCIASNTRLPSLDPSKAPPFMNRVIALCRAEKPEDRPPAWKILQEFPPPAEGNETPRVSELSVGDEDTPAEDDMVAWPINIRCRRCQAPTADHYYHCGRCLIAVFYDTCPKCFSGGHHCLDDDHYLQELRKREPQGKYYSCVGEDGQREVLTC